MLAPTFGQNRARSTRIHDSALIYESHDNLFTLKIHHSGNFTTLPDRRYCYAVLEWYDFVDSKSFSIYGYDALLEDLGIKDGSSILFSHFRIPGKSLDEGLVQLISNQDVLHLLEYVPRYKEIEVYVEKLTIQVVSGKGKGVFIEEIVEYDKVVEASETGNMRQPLLLDEYDVQTTTEHSTSKVDHLPLSKKVKAEQKMQGPLYYDFHPLMYDSDYDGDDEAEENLDLFDEINDLLQRLPFLNDGLKENVVGVDVPVVVVETPVIALEDHLERIEHVVDEEIERPKKRKRENEDRVYLASNKKPGESCIVC